MLINFRNALMAGKRLPYDAEVEFLQSTGTQWIDTGYVPTSTSGAQVVGEFISLPTSDYSGFFGCKTTGVSDRFWAVSSNQNNGTLVGFGNNYTMASASLNTIYTTQVNYKNSRTATFTSTANVSGFNNGGTKPVFLFAVNIGAQAYYQGSMRIYSAQLTESSEIVRDFIPVRVGTVGYLYDRVSGKLFGNAGTGDFVVGQDVVPVEYLQSTGTQWIATGIEAGRTSSSIKITATLKFTELSTGEHDLAGSGNAATPTMGRNGSNYFMWAKGGTTWYPTGCDTNWHTVSYTFNNPSGRVFELDGALYSGTQDNTFATGDGIHIFASGPNRYPLDCQLAKLEIWQNGVLVRKFLSVRVGTEGAMMDVLTRRIYRNAGTGAFTYGNDLKYPIPAS